MRAALVLIAPAPPLTAGSGKPVMPKSFTSTASPFPMGNGIFIYGRYPQKYQPYETQNLFFTLSIAQQGNTGSHSVVFFV
jgi:hypothetical protein